MNIYNLSEEFFGETLSFETGKLAKQADGAVTVRIGDTILLATAVSSKTVKEDQDFFPLTVEYQERYTAAGKFRGGYLKRESKPTQKEILVSRLTDRPLRPLFQDGFLYEVQVEVMVISADKKNDPDVFSIVGASLALCVSSIPFNGPVGAVRIGRVAGKLIINPSNEQRKSSDIDIILSGSRNGILMVEGSSDLINEDEMLAALDFGYDAIKKQLDIIEKFLQKVSPKKDTRELFPVNQGLIEKMKTIVNENDLKQAIYTKGKHERSKALDEKFNIIFEKFAETDPELSKNKIKEAFKEYEKQLLRKAMLSEKIRADGRGLENIRDIWIETGLLPRTHGSSIFTRGETQALAVVTLGGGKDAQRSEELGEESEDYFYLHYTFPGYSVGECKPKRGPGRREIGHGELAERALSAVVPQQDKFPYVIRLTSDILESNGSSSMASVCAGSLALMDAGVPVKASVAGIAMGLIKEGDDIVILSDIMGLEDSLGDMDFKVAGTKEGISALQMDIKIEGLTRDIMKKALEQAKKGRLHILNIMDQALSSHKELSKYAPRIVSFSVAPDKIGMIIGTGGKNIRSLIEKYTIDIDIDDSGLVTLKGEDINNIEACKIEIETFTADIEVNKIYKGVVKKIVDFGAFIECLPGKEGLLHISRISNQRINNVSDVLSLGQTIEVKCIDVDEKGRPVLSRKVLLPNQ